MHATDLIETNIGPACQSMHTARFGALSAGVTAALAGKCVSVTALGRRSPRAVSEKASIKQMDRLVGNNRLVAEAPTVYRAMTRWIVDEQRDVLIVVDWSPVSVDGKFHVLRASVPAGGRGKTLYQEVHPQAKYANREVQKNFLQRLSTVLPEGVHAVVVSDAGFKNPWFRAVEALGWDWVGRVRGTVQLSRQNQSTWVSAKLLGNVLESDEMTYMGRFVLSRNAPLSCSVHGLRKPPKGRVDRNRNGLRAQSSSSRKCADGQREPWLLATSLAGGEAITEQVIGIYTKRMQIEESFRDTKSEYFGLGLSRARSRTAERFTVLLLINALALFVAWLHGKVAELRHLHRRYQANTVTHRRVLSFVFLGLRVLSREPLDISPGELRRAREDLANEFAVPAFG